MTRTYDSRVKRVQPHPTISPVLLQCGREGWFEFSEPEGEVRAQQPGEIGPALDEIEAATRDGRYAAGFVCYEAAGAFDAALVTHAPDSLPLLWFGLYAKRERIVLPPAPRTGAATLPWRATLNRDDFRDAVSHIRERIADGDTYQVNFTWRLETPFEQDPFSFFLEIAHQRPGTYSAFLEVDQHAICSFSPELFFELDGEELVCRPMKGTSPRGLYGSDDQRKRAELRSSIKDRSENVMIVDMVRNDLGRVARPGSVRTTRLFDVETYPTVLQMTSTVSAETDAGFSEIMTALFPCASITGAPKVETMKIINALEDRPREIYTGAIGFVGPNRQALFNVAIRTVQIDRDLGRAKYGTGGGIVWDSNADAEYAEGKTKAQVLTSTRSKFSLLETLRWAGGRYHLLDRHLARLADSARHFGFEHNRADVIDRLDEKSRQLGETGAGASYRVRLLLARDGSIRVEHQALRVADRAWRIELAHEPIDPSDPSYYHKTTARGAYDAFRRQAPSADDVLLWNPSRELTETTLANVALRLEGAWYTPPVACGLLAGTERAELLATGKLAERVLTIADLERAEVVALMNSVRGWIPAQLTTADAVEPRRALTLG